MPKPIISDTSCFIVLSNIGELELLRKVYGQIITTPDVALEYGQILPEWNSLFSFMVKVLLHFVPGKKICFTSFHSQ
jgi:predicted nucleic acid-binding protein